MPRTPQWKVRVKRAVEEWVQVEAESALDAESEAYNVPGVVSVFGQSAIRADFVPPEERQLGVLDD